MIGAFARFSKQRLAQALWLDNKGEGGFRWFHEQGLPAPYVLNQVQINVGQTVSDEILKLRLIAAQSDGRLIDTKDPKKLADEFDRDALHISLTLRGQVVAAGRLIFLNGDRRRSEIDRQLTQLHHQVIAVPGTVEISRVCT
ncbi:MAG: hypothetical protein NTX25_15855, partial [Proteobacteria bacterium]|nr:hypothetical protein [Pseudomonadota bacterium]